MARPLIEVAANHPTRCRTYQAPDPEWAPAELLERVRQRLWAIDPRLNIWWNPHWKLEDKERPGRWGIVYWLQRSSCWSVVEYWEGVGGEYRPITPECIDEIVARIRASEEEADVASRRLELSEQIRKAKEEEELAAALNEHYEDARERTFGVRQTFGRGHIRRRRSLQRAVNEEANAASRLAEQIAADQQRRREERAEQVRRRGRQA